MLINILVPGSEESTSMHKQFECKLQNVGWFSSVKKALSYGSKNQKSKKDRLGRFQNNPDEETTGDVVGATNSPSQSTEVKVHDHDTNRNAYALALATAAAAKAAAMAAQAAAEVVRLTTTPHHSDHLKEQETAGIKIQTIFRGYLARRQLRALKGLVRLKSLIEDQPVKRQSIATLHCKQNLSRLQSQVRERWIRLSEENQSLQRQCQANHEEELENMKCGEDWNDSRQSKKQIEVKLRNRQEAAIRRERALAYAYSRKTRRNVKPSNQTLTDPSNPYWGWCWLERWMTARPWETRSLSQIEKYLNDYNNSSIMSGGRIVSRNHSVSGDHTDYVKYSSSPTVKKSSTRHVLTKQPSASKTRSSYNLKGSSTSASPDDQLAKKDLQSERYSGYRRHSFAGSSLRNDYNKGGLERSPSSPSHSASTSSMKVKGKLPPSLSARVSDKINGTREKGNRTKKSLTFPASLGTIRRHPVPGSREGRSR